MKAYELLSSFEDIQEDDPLIWEAADPSKIFTTSILWRQRIWKNIGKRNPAAAG